MISFKSIPEMYEKEQDGRKPNTLRKYDRSDERFEALVMKEITCIQINNTKTGEFFTRKITDVTFWEGWVLISWEHENDD